MIRPPLLLVPLALALVPGLAGCSTRPPPLPSPNSIVLFEIPWAGAFPSDAVVDHRGRLWFTDRLTHALGVLDPETGEFRRLATPTPKSAPYDIVRGPDGTLWFAESNGGRLGRVDPESESITEVRVEGLRHGPLLLAWGHGGIWFTARRDSAWGHHDPATGRTLVGRGVTEPYGIAVVDGEAWVAGMRGTIHHVGREAGQPLDSIPVRGDARRMTDGPEGRLWLTQHGRGRVVSLDPRTGSVEVVEALPQPARPYGIATDAWGRVWYAERGNRRVVVLNPATGARTYIAVPGTGTIRDIVVDSERRRAWLPISDAGVIGLLEF